MRPLPNTNDGRTGRQSNSNQGWSKTLDRRDEIIWEHSDGPIATAESTGQRGNTKWVAVGRDGRGKFDLGTHDSKREARSALGDFMLEYPPNDVTDGGNAGRSGLLAGVTDSLSRARDAVFSESSGQRDISDRLFGDGPDGPGVFDDMGGRQGRQSDRKSGMERARSGELFDHVDSGGRSKGSVFDDFQDDRRETSVWDRLDDDKPEESVWERLE